MSTGAPGRKSIRIVMPQLCHFCAKRQEPGAVVFVPRISAEIGGKQTTWEPPVIVCEKCKGKPQRAQLFEAVVGAEVSL